mmetsp:Transcript_17461/g.31278  ORF Transcript_17461/g.31278 Transcript_17461/m.31278 type:complete len:495 (+) Transcript_17461:29-1513(+)
MLLIMRRLALVLACLVSVRHGRRTHMASKHIQGSGHRDRGISQLMRRHLSRSCSMSRRRKQLRASGQVGLEHQVQALAKVLLASFDPAVDANEAHPSAVLGDTYRHFPKSESEVATGNEFLPNFGQASNDDLAAGASDASEDEFISDSSLGAGGSTQKVEGLDCQRAVETLKSDIGKILNQEPHWEVFTDDFKVIDETGTRLEGLEACKMHLESLRRFPQRFSINDDLQFIFLDGQDIDQQCDPMLVGRWKIRLGGVTIPFLRFFKENVPLDIEVETLFHFTDNNQVDYMRVQDLLVNGVELQDWLAHGDGIPTGKDVMLEKLQLLKSYLIEALMHAEVYAEEAKKQCATAYTYFTSGEGREQCQKRWRDIHHAALAVFVHAMALVESSRQLVGRSMAKAAVQEDAMDSRVSMTREDDDAMDSLISMDDSDDEMDVQEPLAVEDDEFDDSDDEFDMQPLKDGDDWITTGPIPAELRPKAGSQRERERARIGLLR